MYFKLPELGEGVYEAELVAWLVKAGDTIKRGQNLMEVLTDKASMEVPAPFTGTIQQLHAAPGQKIKVGEPMLTYNDGKSDEPEPPVKVEKKKLPATREKGVDGAKPVASPAPVSTAATSIKAAPSVRYLARKMGVDLGRIAGTGPGGRILLDDLSGHLGEAKPVKPAVEAHPEFGVAGTRIKLQGVRRRIAEHLVHAKQTIPHYTYVEEIDVTEMVCLRSSLREPFSEAGLKLTYLAFVAKAAAYALKEVPMVNASLDDSAGEIVLHSHYHLGIAVATANGLVVPVIRDADKKDLAKLSQEIEQLSAKARNGKLALDEVRGSTFTITSIGNVGGLFATPIINHPEVGILGIGRVVKRPVFDDKGNIKAADMLYLSFAFDHRVVDGAVGAAFGNALCRRLQKPAALLLPEKLIG